MDLGDFALPIHDVVEEGVAWGYGPGHTTLDKILVDAAVESGAELRAGFTADEYLFDGDRVTGIRGRDENIAMARFQPVPLQVRTLRAALRENPAEATRFWKGREGMFDRAERLV